MLKLWLKYRYVTILPSCNSTKSFVMMFKHESAQNTTLPPATWLVSLNIDIKTEEMKKKTLNVWVLMMVKVLKLPDSPKTKLKQLKNTGNYEIYLSRIFSMKVSCWYGDSSLRENQLMNKKLTRIWGFVGFKTQHLIIFFVQMSITTSRPTK